MPSGLKLVVVGGGSSYTPELIQGIIAHRSDVAVERIALVDVTPGAERQRVVRGLAERLIKKSGLTIHVEEFLDLKQALKGADIVFSQLRVGGMKARARDERIPARYGLLGQETVGPGGFANALRTIPTALEIAEAIEQICPKAWCLNFTNPSGMVTEAILRHSSVRTIGLCNVPFNIQAVLATVLSKRVEDVSLLMYGLNHLSFVRRVLVEGSDITDVVLAFLRANGQGTAQANIQYIPFSGRVIEAIGLIPNDYLRYYWYTREMVRRQREDLEAGEGTRAIRVMAIEADLFRKYRDPHVTEVPSELAQRGGAHYSDVAISLMLALVGGQVQEMAVNVLNQGAIDGLGWDAGVEVTCRVDQDGAHPLAIGAMDLPVRGLIQQVKAYEELTIQAAVACDRAIALAALIANPLVPSAEVAENLLDDILLENQADLSRGWSR